MSERNAKLSTELQYPFNLLADVPGIGDTYKDVKSVETDNVVYPVITTNDGAERHLPSDIEGSVEYALYTLSERARDVLHYRYRDGMTLKDIGRLYGVTCEPIRQTLAKGLRYLAHPSRSVYLRYGVKGMMAHNAEKVRAAAIEEYIRSGADAEKTKGTEPELLETPIACMDLSVRAYNCLKRAGCDTAEDVYNLGLNIYKVRNLGVKSVAEVVKWFEKNGFDTERFDLKK